MMVYKEPDIAALFEDYFNNNPYLPSISLNKAYSLIQNIEMLSRDFGYEFADQCEEALQYAYDMKYGNWEEVSDLRKIYPDSWFKPVEGLFNEINATDRLIDIGCNNGYELKEILGNNFYKPELTLIDISARAIYNLQQSLRHRHMEVINESFLKGNLRKEYYTHCLALRTLHSSGMNTMESLDKCFAITKSEGVFLFSIANGYVDSETQLPIKGMCCAYTGLIDLDKPYQIVKNMQEKLISLGVREIEITDGDSEIFISGKKP